MKLAVWIALLGVCMPVWAAARAGYENTSTDAGRCPVAVVYFAPSLVPGKDLELKFKDQSAKAVIGIDLGLGVMDAVGDFHPTVAGGVQYTGKVKAGKSTTLLGYVTEWDWELNRHTFPPGARVWVRKIAFADGSTWADNGTKECRLTEDDRKH